MAWTGPRGAVPTQLHAGQGWADCFPTALQFYLRQAGKLPLVDDVLTQMADVARVVRGFADGPNNPDVNLSQADAAFAHYGVKATWTPSWQDAITSPWAILLVNGARLAPPNYPESWFAGADWPDHFVVGLPFWKGDANWFLDPLNPQKQYCRYDLDSIAPYYGGAYLLPTTNHGETPPQRFTALRAFSLKTLPDHVSTGLITVPKGGTGLVEQGPDPAGWGRYQFRDRHGFAPAEYLTIGG